MNGDVKKTDLTTLSKDELHENLLICLDQEVGSLALVVFDIIKALPPGPPPGTHEPWLPMERVLGALKQSSFIIEELRFRRRGKELGERSL